MPYAPTTPFKVDEYLAQGFADVAKSIDEYKSTQQQAEMQQGFLQAAKQMGLPGYDEKLAEFAKGNLNKKLQLGSEAALALKMAMEQQRQNHQTAELGENKRQFDVTHPSGWQPSATRTVQRDPSGNQVGPAATVIQTSPFSGTARFEEPPLPEPSIEPVASQTIPGLFLNPRTGSPITPPDPTGAAKPPSEADVAFDSNVAVAMQQLDELEGVVKSKGNWENNYGDPEAVAKLKALPYNLAILSAKIVDPSSVAREGEVESAKKFTIPLGWGTKNSETLAAIAERRKLFSKYSEERKKAQGVAPAERSPGLLFPGAPGGTAAPPLDKPTAAKFLQQAGGDRAKARELARAAGYSF